MITANTRLLGVFGNPVSQSLSPLIHNAAIARAGFDAVYLAFKTESANQATESIRAMGMAGANITIHFKVSIINSMDKLHVTARQIGAVNTIVNNKGILTGYNTDASGAIMALKQRTKIKGKHAVVLGAGGAARAVTYGLIQEGAMVTVANRTVSRAKALARHFSCDFVPLARAGSLAADILINTTSVGMGTNKAPIKLRHRYDVVFDIVYKPKTTELLRQAARKGAATIPGLDMLVYQAAESFRLWFGKEPDVRLMKAVAARHSQ